MVERLLGLGALEHASRETAACHEFSRARQYRRGFCFSQPQKLNVAAQFTCGWTSGLAIFPEWGAYQY